MKLLLIFLIILKLVTCPNTAQNLYVTGNQVVFGGGSLCFTFTLSNNKWILVEPLPYLGYNSYTIVAAGASYLILNSGYWIRAGSIDKTVLIAVVGLVSLQLCVNANTQTIGALGTPVAVLTVI